MPQAVRARAFDPFFTTKPIGQGTGLGLSMVYGFARQSEGHARIYSETGPRHDREALSAALSRRGRGRAGRRPPPSAPHRAQRGETVLVIEDEASVRELVIEVLNDLGYRALEAADGPAGLQDAAGGRAHRPAGHRRRPARHERPPGRRAARELRPGLKVLFITGYAENAALAHGFLAPGMEMMTKPFAVEALAARIREMIGVGDR